MLAAIPALVVAASAPASSAHATPRPRLVVGRGAWIAGHTDFVGYYLAGVGRRRVKVYCVSPDRRQPRRVALHAVSRVPSTSVRVTRLLAATLSAHGNARSTVRAEAVSQALNTEIGNRAAVARRARYLPARVSRLAAGYVAEARRRHGPYRLALHLRSSPLPGRTATGTVTLRAPAGPVAGVVRLRHTANVEMPHLVSVNHSGAARFTYRTVGGGAVHIAASVRAAPIAVRLSDIGRSTQVMLTWSSPSRVSAYASYQGSGPGFGHRYQCSTDCDGRPDVTLTACAPASRYRSRITFWMGRRTHRLSFPAADDRRCKSWTAPIADGTPVSATWRYRTPDGWTRRLPAHGAFTVDCPAAPPVAVLVHYDCAAATLSATLGGQRHGALAPLRNTSRHAMVLLLRGALTARVDLAPGAVAAVRTFSVACGGHAAVTLRGGVQRSSGGYNLGPPVDVRLP